MSTNKLSRSSFAARTAPAEDAAPKRVADTFVTAEDEPQVKTSFNFPVSVHKALRLTAVEEGRPARAILLDALAEYLSKKTK
jgi:hypothetical protein